MEVVSKKLGVQGEDVESWKLMIKPQRNRRRLPRDQKGLCIVHSSFLDFLVPAHNYLVCLAQSECQFHLESI